MSSKVLIIGGGVIGLAIARSLHKKGFNEITILERGEIGKESSFAAAGMLAPQAETDKIDDFFHLCNESNLLYPKFAKELLEETGVDIELDQNGTLYLAFHEGDVEEIRRRFEWQKSAGLQVEYLTARQIKQAEPFVSPDVLEGLFFPNDWQVENRKLLAALIKYAELNEIKIIENAKVENLLIENEKAIGAETSDYKYSGENVIIATGAWTSLIKAGEIPMPKIKPIRGQMMSFHTAKRLFQRVIYSPRGYIVPRKLGRILAGATVEDVGFDKNITEEGIEFIRQNALEISPSLASLPLDEKWSGLRPFAENGLPILGSFPQCGKLFIATAHYRNGILLAPLTAEITANKIAKISDSKYLEIFGLNQFENSAKSVASIETFNHSVI
jgi:glycine oxidase